MNNFNIKKFPDGFNILPNNSDGEYLLISKKGDKKPFKISVEKLSALLGVAAGDIQRVQAVPAGPLPTPDSANKYMVVTDVGTWTYGGVDIGSNADGYQTTFWFTGTTWVDNGSVRVKGDAGQSLLPLYSEDIVKPGFTGFSKNAQVRDENGQTYVSLKDTNTDALTVKASWEPIGDAQLKSRLGLNPRLIEQNLTGITNEPSKNNTYIIAEPITEDVKNIEIYSPKAGNIIFGSYELVGSIFYRRSWVSAPVIVGKNDITIVPPIANGHYFGFVTTSASGLVGVIEGTTSQYQVYKQSGIVSEAGATAVTPVNTIRVAISLGGDFSNPITDKVAGVEYDIQDLNTDSKSYLTEFVTQIGSLVPDFETTPNKMTLDFTSGNQSVVLIDSIAKDDVVKVKFSAKIINGTSPMALKAGQFSSSTVAPITHTISVTTLEQEFELEVKGNDLGNFSIGVLSAQNAGQVVEFSEITIDKSVSLKSRVEVLEAQSSNSVGLPFCSFNLDSSFHSLTKNDKKLLKIGVVGDSLMANPTGGAIPDIEPVVSERPLRLGQTNTISRRLYDFLSWNKPTWKRVDNVAWTKSGTWTAVNTTSYFEPTYANETYHTATPSSEATITVPQGNENFALVYQVAQNRGDIEVYLNNVLHTTLNSSKATAGHTGNPYKVLELLGLPDQDNTIKIVAKSSNTNNVSIWGAFYWTGNTLVVMNTGHGGHTIRQLLDNHIQDEVVDNNFDAILFEHTLMNDTARISDAGNSIGQSVSALKDFIELFKTKDLVMMGCQPYGLTQNGLTNYYTSYPGMLEMKNALKQVVFENGLPYIDIFELFKRKIEAKGGTLVGGQGGTWYTHDGQHQNELGMEIYWEFIKSVITQIPLKIS